jgi:hypothetical protein
MRLLKRFCTLSPVILFAVLSAASANAQAIPPLTINQLLYATIPNFATDPSQMVMLNDGKLGGATGDNYFIGLNTGADTYATGDFLNTGQSDIAATVLANGGGTGVFTYLVIFINNSGAPQYLTAASLGDRITLNKISYSNGIFSADIITQGPNDPMCCGTLHQVQQYQLKNGSLVVASNPSSGTTPTTNANVPTNNPQVPISAVPDTSSSTDSSQWFILGGIIIIILFIIGFAQARRRRARKIAEGRNPNTANAIYLTIIGIAFLFAENEVAVLIGLVIMFFAWRLYARGKTSARARTAERGQETNTGSNENPASENQAQEPIKKRRSTDDPEMKKLYRRLMHKYHPDRGKNKGDDKFRNDLTAKINKAYQEGDFETLKLFE